jgi:hypothetical protein
MAENATDFEYYGLPNPAGERKDGRDFDKTYPNPLADHPAVTGYRSIGITTEDLISFIESFASLRSSRVKGVGHDQYSHAKGQKFESFTISDTIKELVEELADAGNYIDFLAIKLLNLQHTIDLVLPDCD